MRDVVIATCVLKKEFLPRILNVMASLSVHLVEQLFICGLVHCRWMYSTERYMKTLKDYVRTTAHPKRSMVEGYRLEDTLGFCTEYMQRHSKTTHRVWNPNEDAIMNDEILRLTNTPSNECPSRCAATHMHLSSTTRHAWNHGESEFLFEHIQLPLCTSVICIER